ncbi:MAG: hypothetical protein M1834_008317 [Cirrosporium novae-zelandiae]|nr:MAG: hypothetical protein M1834_008317 [Cirrosporium novae-zelandiae]
MAETTTTTTAMKRHNTGPKVPVATPNINVGSGTSIAPLETALVHAIGARVKITTAGANPQMHEGTIFACDPITSLVAISTVQRSMTFIPISSITSFHLLSTAPNADTNATTSSSSPSPFTTLQPPIHPLSTSFQKQREAAAIAAAKALQARRGKGVTREGQEIFDALARTLPVRWDAKNVVVSDNVVIEAPYRVEDCKAIEGKGQNAQHALVRVRKVVEGERRKILERAKAATAGREAGAGASVGQAQRKGG